MICSRRLCRLWLALSFADDVRCLETEARNFPNAAVLAEDTTTFSRSHSLHVYKSSVNLIHEFQSHAGLIQT